MPEEPWRLHVCVVGEGPQRGAEPGLTHRLVERRASLDDDTPCIRSADVAEDLLRARAAQLGETRVELAALPFAQHADGPGHTADATEHLGFLRDVDDPHDAFDLLAGQP